MYLVITFAVIRSLDPLAIATVWTRWDGGTYTHIAADGYPSLVNVAFFFPLLEHIVMPLTGGVPSAAGLLIANVSSLAPRGSRARRSRARPGLAKRHRHSPRGPLPRLPPPRRRALHRGTLPRARHLVSARAPNAKLSARRGAWPLRLGHAACCSWCHSCLEYLRLHDWKPRSLLGPQNPLVRADSLGLVRPTWPTSSHAASRHSPLRPGRARLAPDMPRPVGQRRHHLQDGRNLLGHAGGPSPHPGSRERAPDAGPLRLHW